MKFLGDIPISRSTISHLCTAGYDAIHVTARLPPTATDAEIIRFAASEARVVLCFDMGMAEIVALSGEKLPSVIAFRLARRRSPQLNRRLDQFLPEIQAELERGALVTVEGARVRVRPLPVY
ncbi:MAG TPA: DUF5615 family PIN-like protein [Phycisphaerae bacterium]|nr:DUF5615 family PIN-like protein [Phycisphaerae bacterium]